MIMVMMVVVLKARLWEIAIPIQYTAVLRSLVYIRYSYSV